jgi:hypothetical protein
MCLLSSRIIVLIYWTNCFWLLLWRDYRTEWAQSTGSSWVMATLLCVLAEPVGGANGEMLFVSMYLCLLYLVFLFCLFAALQENQNRNSLWAVSKWSSLPRMYLVRIFSSHFWTIKPHKDGFRASLPDFIIYKVTLDPAGPFPL